MAPSKVVREAGKPYSALLQMTGESDEAPSEVRQSVIWCIVPRISGTWSDAEVRLRRCRGGCSLKEEMLAFVVSCMNRRWTLRDRHARGDLG